MSIPLFLLHNAQLISHQSLAHTKKIPHRMLHNGSCQWKGTLASQHNAPFYLIMYTITTTIVGLWQWISNRWFTFLQIKECPDFFHRELGILDHTITKCTLYHLSLQYAGEKKRSISLSFPKVQRLACVCVCVFFTFFCWSWIIFCSIVRSMTSRTTWTGRRWPILCTRSMACSIVIIMIPHISSTAFHRTFSREAMHTFYCRIPPDIH